MKVLFSFLFSFISSFALCQEQDSLGIDNNKRLSSQEAIFLNNALQNNRNDFNFENKQVAFITGSSGRTIVTKSQYFKTYVHAPDDRRAAPHMFMVILSKEEKAASGGYDVLIFSWLKVAFSDKLKKRIIERLQTSQDSQ